MIIWGVIFIIAGGISWFYGSSQNNNMDVQLSNFFEDGEINTGDIFVIAGILLFIVGVILLVVGFARVIKNKNADEDIKLQAEQSIPNTQKRFCSFCGKKLNLLIYIAHIAVLNCGVIINKYKINSKF